MAISNVTTAVFSLGYQPIKMSAMNTHTARARAAAHRHYLAFVEKSHKKDLTAWIDDMQSRGLAANTIRQRVYLLRAWLGTKEEVTLPTRLDVSAHKWLDTEQVQALLVAVPKNRKGLRDFALIAVFLVSGLRLDQVRHWKWSDLHQLDQLGIISNVKLPKVIGTILHTLALQRLDSCSSNMHPSSSITGDSYIFTASKFCLPICKQQQVHRSIGLENKPLSPQEINRRIGRYARLAGLEPEGITAECLRRTHKELGESIIVTLIQDAFLNHMASPIRWKRVERDNRLHGIGRRQQRR